MMQRQSMESPTGKETFYRRAGKRLFDLAVTVPALLLLAPVFALLAVLVRLSLGSPVLFKSQRPGLHGRPFSLYKFRTMRNDCDEKGRLLPDHERLTRLGSFLRDRSLDELPELYNVLKGEMSLIGPRPLLMEYLDVYTPEQMRRHDVPPGISGWAQITGRNSIGWEEKIELDLWYVDHLSFALDLKILLMTIPKVVLRENVHYAENVGFGKPKRRNADGTRAVL